MVTVRSLTEVFILMRNNAVQSRHIFSEPTSSSGGGGNSNNIGFSKINEDRLSLVPLSSDHNSHVDIESNNDTSNYYTSRMPPEWVNLVDEVQYEMSRIKNRLKDLQDLQHRHVTRPNFDDDNAEEQKAIKKQSEELTSMLAHCQRLIQHIQKASISSTGNLHSRDSTDLKLAENVSRSLLNSLQLLTNDFRSAQSAYLKQLQRREEDYKQYFGSNFSPTDRSSTIDWDSVIEQAVAGSSGIGNGSINGTGQQQPQLTMAQIQAIEDQAQFVEHREKEILQITKSLVELNEMFKEVGQLVVEQGSVVDRIDFNVEQAGIRVKTALTHVKKAEQYQKKNKKLMIIVVLAAIITLLFVILIISKF